MKRIVLIASLAASAATPAPAQNLESVLAQMRKRWDASAEPFRVIGNIHYVGTKGLAAYLITSSQGHVLIDTVMPGNTATTKAAIEKLGFKVSDIRYLVNTHAHLDHTGGFADIKKASGAQMVAGAKDKPLLESGTYPGREHVAALKFPPVSVDRAVNDGDVLTLGPIRLVAHATPGHSPGCTTWTMKVKEGDAEHGVIFFCSGTVALNRLVGAPTHAGIVEDYRRTFAAAAKIEGDVLLAPHPEMFDMDAKRAAMAPGAPNPFIRPGEFQAYLGKLKGAFETALARQEAEARK